MVKKLLMIAMAVTMISGTSIATVYANANPPAEETTTQVVEETATESTEDTEKKEDTGRVTGEGDNSAFSTPGNAQLVDDKENDDTKQFLTIQTKKGNTFYMVIDRSSNTENVYMMSLVDENDLAEFLDETEKSKETEESTVVIPETTPETTPVAEEETEVKKEEKKEEPQEMIPAKDEALLAPVSGKVIPLSEVRDEAFAGGILGQGAAVIPENGEICAPCDGVISVMYPTGHAVGIKSDIGAEILIHVGMDMVTLNGSCFDVKVKAGDHVKAGQLLVRADIEGIKKEGLDITTPVIVANTADYMQIKTAAGECVKRGEVLLNCVSK